MLRASETEDHPAFRAEDAPPETEPLTAAEVAALARPEHRLRVLVYADRVNRGQGVAMSLALSHARAGLVAQMESDDERGPEVNKGTTPLCATSPAFYINRVSRPAADDGPHKPLRYEGRVRPNDRQAGGRARLGCGQLRGRAGGLAQVQRHGAVRGLAERWAGELLSLLMLRPRPAPRSAGNFDG